MIHSPNMIIVTEPNFMNKIRRAIGRMHMDNPPPHATILMELLRFEMNNATSTTPSLILPDGSILEDMREDFIELTSKLYLLLPDAQRVKLQYDSDMGDDIFFLVTEYIPYRDNRQNGGLY